MDPPVLICDNLEETYFVLTGFAPIIHGFDLSQLSSIWQTAKCFGLAVSFQVNAW
jgi:hypothetical protein